MPFLTDNEFIILMSPNEYCTESWEAPLNVYVSTLEDRKKFRDCGIQTSMEYPVWSVTEPEEGKYTFYLIDKIIQKNRNAGLKTILSIPDDSHPSWMPDEWFVKSKEGKVNRHCLSFWNKDAEEHLRIYCKTILDRYDADDVMCIFGEYGNGELLLPTTPSFYDENALFSYIAYNEKEAVPDIDDPKTLTWAGDEAVGHVVYIQNEFYKKRKEIWNMQQWLYNQWSKATLNFTQPQIFSWYKDIFPDAHSVLLQYTYFDDSHPKENEDWVDNIRNTFGCDVIVEAMFCDGLPTTAPKAIAKGFRGQIVCPAHPFKCQYNLESWMFKEIDKAHKLWEKSWKSKQSSWHKVLEVAGKDIKKLNTNN